MDKIDKIDDEKGYEKTYVEWLTPKLTEQDTKDIYGGDVPNEFLNALSHIIVLFEKVARGKSTRELEKQYEYSISHATIAKMIKEAEKFFDGTHIMYENIKEAYVKRYAKNPIKSKKQIPPILYKQIQRVSQYYKEMEKK